jgi:pimeloyl-ACP methyl ester carboxylesterase
LPTEEPLKKSVNVSGIATAYLEMGRAVPLLLLHGFGPGGSARGNWSDTIAPLSGHFRVLAPDLLGFGDTGVPAQPSQLDFDTSAGHIADFLDATGIKRAHVIGNNYGAALAIKLAIAHPERVSRMVLMSPPAIEFPIGPELSNLWGYQPSPDNMLRLMRSFVHDRERISPDAAIKRHDESLRPGILQAFAALFRPPHGETLRALTSPHAALARLSAPILLLHGREDRIIPVGVSKRLHQVLPNADLHVFANCGNLIHAERRDDFLRLAVGFLAGS